MATPTPSPRSIAESFCHAANTRNFDALFALGAPDATWWVVGRPELGSKYGGQRPFADFRPAVDSVLGQFERFEFTTLDITVGESRPHAGEKGEGETTKVIIEGAPRGESATGAIYRNDNLIVLTVRNGKIVAVREWFDAKEIEAYFDAVKQ